MKSAKEWAAEVVVSKEREEPRSGRTVVIMFENGDDWHVFDEIDATLPTLDEEVEYYREMIERLVERAQADARAQLTELLSEVRESLAEVRRFAPEGGRTEELCERLLPRIEEALR